MFETRLTSPKAVPLYHATLRVFRDLVEHLMSPIHRPLTDLATGTPCWAALTAPKGHRESDP